MKSASVQEPVDLTNCEKEAIRIPGSIQSHGLLLVLQEPDLTILQVSSNTTELLGISPEALLQQKLTVLLGQSQVDQLKKNLHLQDLQLINPLKLHIIAQDKELAFDGSIHRINQLLILELEPLSTFQVYSYWELYHAFELVITRLQSVGGLTELCQFTTQEIRKLTGFDRVMVYRFDQDWNGTVIAEDRRDDLDSFLDLHFPGPVSIKKRNRTGRSPAACWLCLSRKSREAMCSGSVQKLSKASTGAVTPMRPLQSVNEISACTPANHLNGGRRLFARPHYPGKTAS